MVLKHDLGTHTSPTLLPDLSLTDKVLNLIIPSLGKVLKLSDLPLPNS